MFALLILLIRNKWSFGSIKNKLLHFFVSIYPYYSLVSFATLIVEKDAKKMSEYSINKVEHSILTLFHERSCFLFF